MENMFLHVKKKHTHTQKSHLSSLRNLKQQAQQK